MLAYEIAYAVQFEDFDTFPYTMRRFFGRFSVVKVQLLMFLSIFGPATITAMADNDANGIATYSIAGAKLGFPILFLLLWVTVLLAITQEMGMRVTLVTRKGLGDLIRENYGIRAAVLIFGAVFIANMGSIITNVTAVKTTASILGIPSIPLTLAMLIIALIIVIKGNYKATQNIMLISSVFYLAYVVSAVKANPNWGEALSNLIIPHGVAFTPNYIRDYIIIGLGVLGTTITPWGQFFISSFSLDKKIDSTKLRFAQIETYWGAILTDVFSFFMIVATAATLFVNKIPLVSGEQAAKAIEPFAGKLAGFLFAGGILNAGFMGVVIISLSTTYAFAEFFGYPRGLDNSYQQSKTFYRLFLIQLIIAFIISLIPGLDLFRIAVTAQTLNAMVLPIIFFYLIKFTSSKKFMGEYINSPLKRNIALAGTALITAASVFAVVATVFHF